MNARRDKLKIVAHRNLTGRYFHLVLQGARIAACAKPGQFVMVKVSDCQIPLLRRPLGIHSAEKGKLGILYEVVGRGTAALSGKKPGESVDVIGPLGNGFDLSPVTCGASPILVAGGMGVAPLLFLAEKIMNTGATVVLGAKTKSGVLCEKEFKKAGCMVKVATDDGSRGFKGSATSLLAKHLAAGTTPSVIYACGPHAMLASVAALTARRGITAFGSFEAHMSCGIGACMGCAIKIKYESSYRRVCTDGPVFPLNQVVF